MPAVAQSGTATVIVNSHTGTVVITAPVKLRTVALTHRNIRVLVSDQPRTAQPAPADAGRTITVPRTRVGRGGGGFGGGREAIVLPANANLQELVDRLRRARVRPRDMVEIFQAIKRAGALDANLIIR